jgi:cystathionine beta-lyase family protein involved in aluminum resistance
MSFEFTSLDPRLASLARTALADSRLAWESIEETVFHNQIRVLDAFRAEGVADTDFFASTGYGYGDRGRERLDRVYARVFEAEAALVRAQIVSGTHAIALALFGVLKPGDELLSGTGRPYDTLEKVIGTVGDGAGSLRELGVAYRQVNLLGDGTPDLQAISGAVGPRTRAAFIQRSKGYEWRRSLDIESIGRVVAAVKAANPETVCVVDNCYGELVEPNEPCSVGADLVAGSLIKNPGGGLAPTGGYLAGRTELVEAAANRLTAPGIGSEVGASLGLNRSFFQGLFLAPHVVGQALQGAVFLARVFELLGFPVNPGYTESRTDLIQAIRLGSPQALITFCQAIQSHSPVDAHVRPVPWDMPGYQNPVIMAAGTFVQGASIELSADGPLREPYAAYVQGGLTREHVIWAGLGAASALAAAGLASVPPKL